VAQKSHTAKCLGIWRESEKDWAKSVFDGGFVDEHVGDILFDLVDPVAPGAFQGLGIVAVLERLLAGWADEDVEKLLVDHAGIVRQRIRANRDSSLMLQ
jgi:hypothetical protein